MLSITDHEQLLTYVKIRDNEIQVNPETAKKFECWTSIG